MRDVQIVGAADDFEVSVLVQIVARDRLAEAYREGVLDGENTVRRGRDTEYLRAAGVLGALQHIRRAGDKAVAVASVGDGTQLVLLLHRVAVAVEADAVDAAARNHRLVARSQAVEAVAGVVGTDIDPIVVRLRHLLVLQLDVVEAVGMDVVAVDRNRQVVARAVVRREGVEHPLVVRSGEIDR